MVGPDKESRANSTPNLALGLASTRLSYVARSEKKQHMAQH